jgi:hypothetical protein
MAAKKTGTKPKAKTMTKPAAAASGAKPAFGSPAWRAKYMKNGGKSPAKKSS